MKFFVALVLGVLFASSALAQIDFDHDRLQALQINSKSLALKISAEKKASIFKQLETPADPHAGELIALLRKHGEYFFDDHLQLLQTLQFARFDRPNSLMYNWIGLALEEEPPHRVRYAQNIIDDLSIKTIFKYLSGRTMVWTTLPNKSVVQEEWNFMASLSGQLVSVHRKVSQMNAAGKSSVTIDKNLPPNDRVAELLWHESIRNILQEVGSTAL